MNGFTNDAEAQEAGITKRGVLHHFPPKEALIDALVEEVLRAFRMRLDEHLVAEPAGILGRWLRAYNRSVFPDQSEESNLLPGRWRSAAYSWSRTVCACAT